MLKKQIAVLALAAASALGLGCTKSNPEPLKASNTTTYTGINLSGAESGSKYPGVEGQDYIWPTTAQIDYYAGKKMNIFRINFMWERMQPTAKGELNATHLAKLKTLVTYATNKGLTVLLNPQNFAKYYGKNVGSADVPNDVFADFWRRMALEFKNNSKVMFGLVNEPSEIGTQQWRLAAQAAINAIRATGATNVITVPGNGWTGMHSWQDNWYDTSGQKLSNAAEMIKITDPGNNFVFEVHQYLDSDFGGEYKTGECVSATIGSDKAKPFVAWLKANNRKAILGEIGTPNTALCNKAMTDVLTYLSSNTDVMVGWIWWNAIRDNFWGNYILDLTPKSGKDDARIGWLSPFFAQPAPTPTPTPTPTPAPTCCPCPTPDAGTPVDAGTDSGTAVKLTSRAAVYNTWNGGYCSKVYVKNVSTTNQTWRNIKVSMQDGSLRDFWTFKTTSKWGAKGEVIFTPGTTASVGAGKEIIVGGFCADGASTKPATVTGVD